MTHYSMIQRCPAVYASGVTLDYSNLARSRRSAVGLINPVCRRRYFWRELSWEYRRIVPAHDLIAVKAMFAQGAKVEHMWIGDVAFDGRVVSGRLLNTANELSGLSAGSAVEIAFPSSLTDWMLASGEKVEGGFTVNLMRSRMSAAERASHDEAWGLPFGDPSRVTVPYASSPTDETDHPMAVNMEKPYREQLSTARAIARNVDADGWTMLHREALAGNRGIAALLLEHGADPNARTPDGRTPVALAQLLGWRRVVDVLAAAGGR